MHPTSRHKINLKNPWRLLFLWVNRGAIGAIWRDPSWVPKFKENEIKGIWAQKWLLEFVKPISLLIATLPTFM